MFIPPESATAGIPIPLLIDGKQIENKQVKRILINRLIKNDGEQATIPIQTFLPFNKKDISNNN